MISLRHHENNSITCLVQRLDGIIETIKDSIPEAYEKVEPLINNEIVKLKKLGQMRGSNSQKRKQDQTKYNERDGSLITRFQVFRFEHIRVLCIFGLGMP